MPMAQMRRRTGFSTTNPLGGWPNWARAVAGASASRSKGSATRRRRMRTDSIWVGTKKLRAMVRFRCRLEEELRGDRQQRRLVHQRVREDPAHGALVGR